MKIETKYIENFLKKFSGLVTGAEIEFTEDGLVFEGIDASATTWNKTKLNKLAFIDYVKGEKAIYLDKNRIEILGKLSTQLNDTCELTYDTTKISLVGSGKKASMALSEKPTDFKEIKGKDWSEVLKDATTIKLKSEVVNEIKNFIKNLKPEKIRFQSNENRLEVLYENKVNGINATQVIYETESGELFKDNLINVCFDINILGSVLNLLSTDIEITIGNAKPILIKETYPTLSTEYIIAPLTDEE